MSFTLPSDIRIEALLTHLPKKMRETVITGSHNRNAYEDIASVSREDEGKLHINVSRNGLYDSLLEALFHPVDRFENIPANVYKERLSEEIAQQQIEEENARRFFSHFDHFILELGALPLAVASQYADGSVISEILSDRLPRYYLENRFVKRTLQYLPICRDIRGDRMLIALMLRFVLYDEAILLDWVKEEARNFSDSLPRYDVWLDITSAAPHDTYLGNEFEESVSVFRIRYRNSELYDEKFPEFIKELEIYRQFLNDFFAGIGTFIEFDLSTDACHVRLSDENVFNYLDYNANL